MLRHFHTRFILIMAAVQILFDRRAEVLLLLILIICLLTAQKMKFSTRDFFSKCDQIRRKKQEEAFISTSMVCLL